MKKFNLLYLVGIGLLVTLLSACSKEKTPTYDFPLKLKAETIEVLNPRLFTKDGEITDKAKVNAYITNNKQWKAFPTNEDFQEHYTEYNITLTASDTVKFFYPETKYSIERVGNIVFFYSLDYPITTVNPVFDASTVLKYAAPKKQVEGETDKYIYKNMYIAKGDFLELSICGLNYRFLNDDRGNKNTSASDYNVYNVLTDDVASKLKQGDTLAVQEYKIHMGKR